MTSSTRHPLRITLAALAALLVVDAAAQAQTTVRSRANDRSRERQAPASSVSPAEPAPAMAQPVSSARSDSQTTLAQNSTENLSGAAGAVRSRVEKELDGQSTEDLIRSAQQRLSTMRNGNSTPTISDIAESANKPAPAPAAPMTAQPVASPSAPPAPARAVAQPIPAPAAAPVPVSDAPRPAAVPSLLTSPVDVPAPIPLRPKYQKEKAANQAMEIESDESIMDNTQRIVTFQGNVFVNHPEFKLASDHLEIHLNEDSNLDGSAVAAPQNAAPAGSEEPPPFKRAIATGGMVEIEKIGADGKTQIAKARKADYDAKTGDIVLSGGPPTLQSGTGFVNPSSPDALIILRGSGQHEVKGGPGGRNTFSIPIKGGVKTTTTPLSGSLDTITNRNDNR